jgi:hypothetical protein
MGPKLLEGVVSEEDLIKNGLHASELKFADLFFYACPIKGSLMEEFADFFIYANPKEVYLVKKLDNPRYEILTGCRREIQQIC